MLKTAFQNNMVQFDSNKVGKGGSLNLYYMLENRYFSRQNRNLSGKIIE
jgi:hypothetical protein